MAKEIEKRFLLSQLPAEDILRQCEKATYVTVYIYTGNPEVRIRKKINIKGIFYTMAVKFGEGISRDEFLTSVNQELFEKMFSSHGDAIVVKSRYKCKSKVKNLVWEIDKFLDRHEGLYIAEIELESSDQIVEVPDWLPVLKEVTNDSRYSNKNLAVYGIPEPV